MINEQFKKLCCELNLNEEEVKEQLLQTFVDGIRRPGSWERGVLESIFPMDDLLKRVGEE